MTGLTTDVRDHAEAAVVAVFVRIVEAARLRRERPEGRAFQLGHVEDAH